MAQDALASALIVIGGSAGSLDVLMQLLPSWELQEGVATVIVLHRKPDSESLLTDLLRSRCKCPVSEARDKEPILSGHIYVAPADYHLLVEQEQVFSLDYSEKVHYSRPSIDVTFETAGAAYGRRAVCVLLSGANNDGTEGLIAARRSGARLVVQLPATAVASFMPQYAVDALVPDALLHPDEMAGYFKTAF